MGILVLGCYLSFISAPAVFCRIIVFLGSIERFCFRSGRTLLLLYRINNPIPGHLSNSPGSRPDVCRKPHIWGPQRVFLIFTAKSHPVEFNHRGRRAVVPIYNRTIQYTTYGLRSLIQWLLREPNKSITAGLHTCLAYINNMFLLLKRLQPWGHMLKMLHGSDAVRILSWESHELNHLHVYSNELSTKIFL